MALAHAIAERIHGLRYEDLTPTALEWTRAAFIDTVGVTLAGTVEDGPRFLMRVLGIAEASGPSLIFASRRRTSPLDAVLVNGTASHALDYNDVSGVLGGHPSAMLIPAMLPLAELVGANGRDLALAYVVGSATECRIARGDRMVHLARTHDLTPERVEMIEIIPHPRRLPHIDNPDPRTPLAAKFSVQYVVGRALADRAVRLEHFEGDAQSDPTIRELMARTRARPHLEMADDSPLQWGAEVVVTTRDGQRLASRLDDFERRGPGGLLMTEEELWEKFSDCARRSLERDKVVPLFERLSRIEALDTISDRMRWLEGDV